MPSVERRVNVSVWRGGESGGFVSYDVPMYDSQTVLDLVTWIQRNLDSTLSYRFACRVGMCGSCAMMVNGAPRWTCRTHVSIVAESGTVEVAPLENLPIVKDLVVDMRSFFEKWQRAKGYFEPSRTRMDPIEMIVPNTPERLLVDEAIECINCGVCYAACDTVRWNPDYLGPAQLNRAWTLVNDVRDIANPARLTAISRDGGCHSCHSHQSCQEFCPVGLNPTASIAGLKRRAAKAVITGEIVP